MEEKIPYLDIDPSIERLSIQDKPQVDIFSCGVPKLDDFFHKEMFLCMRHHYISAFCAKNKAEIVAIFTLMNDAVIIDNIDKEDFLSESSQMISDEYTSIFQKQTSFPAINIGHLGVKKEMQSKGIGRSIVDFVLYTFSEYEISGCQFITVDSLNNPDTNRFYMNNGFLNQTNNDMTRRERRMYLPIQIYKQSAN